MTKPRLVSEEQDAFGEQAADAMEAALREITADGLVDVDTPMSRVKRVRMWAETQLDRGQAEESELQTKLAAANAAYDSTVAIAGKERDEIIAEINAKLKDATGLRAALAVFKGELTKAEM